MSRSASHYRIVPHRPGQGRLWMLLVVLAWGLSLLATWWLASRQAAPGLIGRGPSPAPQRSARASENCPQAASIVSVTAAEVQPDQARPPRIRATDPAGAAGSAAPPAGGGAPADPTR